MALTRITSAGISDGVIDVADISDNTITGAKLASDIAITTSGTIAANTVTASNSTIAGSNLANAAFLAGDTTTGLGIDSNEVISKGNNLLLGVADTGLDVEFRENNVERIRLELDSTPTIKGTGDTSLASTGFLSFITNTSSERMRISSSGEIGIGTSDPQYRLESVGTNGGGEVAGLAVRNNSTTAGSSTCIYFVNSTDPTSAANRTKISSIRNGSADHELAFFTNDGSVSERMRIDSSGHVIIPNGVTLGTSAGTYLASNTLDDYEEGTFTPVMTSAGGSITYSERAGIYNKIGNMVCCWFIVSANLSSATGGYGFSGFPFNCVDINDHNFRYSGTTSFQTSTGSTTPLMIQFNTASTVAIYRDTGGTQLSSSHTTASNFQVRCAITYRTS